MVLCVILLAVLTTEPQLVLQVKVSVLHSVDVTSCLKAAASLLSM